MLTEAVMDGSQAIRDPVGGSVEFHFVPILKLISTLLIMGIFNDEDAKHILKMIDPNVFGPAQKKASEEEGEGEAEDGGAKEQGEEAKEKEEATEGEAELLDEGVGEEEEDEELKALKKEEGEEGEETEKAEDVPQGGQKVDGEKAEEEKEAEEGGEVEQEEEEEAPEEGLLQMKLPESVKLQVSATTSAATTSTTKSK